MNEKKAPQPKAATAEAKQSQWKAPKFQEICLNCEVASYESGELESTDE